MERSGRTLDHLDLAQVERRDLQVREAIRGRSKERQAVEDEPRVLAAQPVDAQPGAAERAGRLLHAHAPHLGERHRDVARAPLGLLGEHRAFEDLDAKGLVLDAALGAGGGDAHFTHLRHARVGGHPGHVRHAGHVGGQFRDRAQADVELHWRGDQNVDRESLRTESDVAHLNARPAHGQLQASDAERVGAYARAPGSHRGAASWCTVRHDVYGDDADGVLGARGRRSERRHENAGDQRDADGADGAVDARPDRRDLRGTGACTTCSDKRHERSRQLRGVPGGPRDGPPASSRIWCGVHTGVTAPFRFAMVGGAAARAQARGGAGDGPGFGRSAATSSCTPAMLAMVAMLSMLTGSAAAWS